MTPNIIQKDTTNLISIDVFSKLMHESNIIFLSCDIDEYIASIINAQLLYLEHKLKNDKTVKTKEIIMYINCCGGEIYSGNSILDTMDFVKSKDITITTINIGLCASMASVILSNGTVGNRYSLKRARTMIHQPLGGANGQLTDIKITAAEMDNLKDGLYDTLAKNSGQKLSKIKKDCERDYYMSATETEKYGIIDRIIV